MSSIYERLGVSDTKEKKKTDIYSRLGVTDTDRESKIRAGKLVPAYANEQGPTVINQQNKADTFDMYKEVADFRTKPKPKQTPSISEGKANVSLETIFTFNLSFISVFCRLNMKFVICRSQDF